MPRQVDHGERRLHVAGVAAELVADGGAEALTVRQVARATGFSTTVVSHYFADRHDLLVATYRVAAARSASRFDDAVQGERALRDGVEALLPLDEARRRDWRVWFAFWGLATADPALGDEQAAHVRSARERLRRVLAAEQARGRVREDADLAAVASALLVFVHGVGTQATFDPSHWSPARQRAALVEQLALVEQPGLVEPVRRRSPTRPQHDHDATPR